MISKISVIKTAAKCFRQFSCCLMLIEAFSLTCAESHAEESRRVPSPAQVAVQVDDLLLEAINKADIKAAPTVNDATFVRRIYLDLVGRIPTVAETREFLTDNQPNKREQLVERLTLSATHAWHIAVFWRRTWVPQADTREFESLAEETDAWIALEITRGEPYDQMVARLLTATSATISPNSSEVMESDAPLVFLRASNYRSEKLAANSARAFLGLNLDCAECHDHPFARWTQDEFWQFAAFFEDPQDAPTGKPPRIKVGETDRMVAAHLFTGDQVQWPNTPRPDEGRRIVAQWMASPENTYLARNAVNRLWAHYLGNGLIEPLDDISESNPAYHPEVMDYLTQAFIDSGYDVRYLSRCIALTDAYQRSSDTSTNSREVLSANNNTSANLFACMPVRAMTGEQLHDSLQVAAGLPFERDDLTQRDKFSQRRLTAKQFLVDRAAEAERSTTQALGTMNGKRIDSITQHGKSPLLQAILAVPFLSRDDRIEMLFLATLNRYPTSKEIDLLFGSSPNPSPEEYEDALWALLNSVEFNTNH